MRDDDQNDGGPWTVEQIQAERRALEIDIAERQARIDRDATLAWSKRHNEPRQTQEVVMSDAARTRTAPANSTQQWRAYIDARIRTEARAGDKAMAVAVGQTIGKELIALERANTALLERVAKLETELAEMRGELKTRAALAQVTERLDRLEATPRSLRVV